MRLLPLLAPALLGFVMPTSGLLKRLATQRESLSAPALKAEGLAAAAPVVARALAEALGVPWQSGELPFTATLAMAFPRRCRVELRHAASPAAVTAWWQEGTSRVEGPAASLQPALEAGVGALCEALATRTGDEGQTRELYSALLKRQGVEPRTTLGRFAGQVAYVVGNREGGAQLWVYKDGFQPARLRTAGTAEAPGWDVRFVGYDGTAGEGWLPRTVEVYRGEELHLRLSFQSSEKAQAKDVKL